MNEKEYVDIEHINIIAKIPANTARLTITAQLFDENGEQQLLRGVMNTKEIWHARQDFLDNVEAGDDYDAVYTITDEGRRWLAELEAKRQSKDEDNQ